MKMVVFDGREFAKAKEKKLKKKVSRLGVTPKLVAILVGNDPGSRLYLSLKKKVAERVGIALEVREFGNNADTLQIVRLIKSLNEDKSIHGIMVQLPLPKSLKPKTEMVLSAIIPTKDVDGLRRESPFMPAVVKAVISILEKADVGKKKKILVIGARGMVGRRLVKELEAEGVDKESKNLGLETKEADILISATGVSNLIKGKMVKEGAIVIDVGAPKGDVLFNEVTKKASFITPVPGGVGPVTIVSLLENVVRSVNG